MLQHLKGTSRSSQVADAEFGECSNLGMSQNMSKPVLNDCHIWRNHHESTSIRQLFGWRVPGFGSAPPCRGTASNSGGTSASKAAAARCSLWMFFRYLQMIFGGFRDVFWNVLTMFLGFFKFLPFLCGENSESRQDRSRIESAIKLLGQALKLLSCLDKLLSC